MADLLGFLAGTGMLALVGTLVITFLRQMGWLRKDTSLLLKRSAGMACGAGVMYLALALLCRLAAYGEIKEALSLGILFRGPYMTRMLPALGNPAGVGPVSLVFAWLSRLAGGLLFGQFEFCGIALAWCMTAASLFLVQKRIGKLADGQTARDAAFLLLCLPGSVFFLLPGWMPMALLACAIAFFLLGKRLRTWIRLSPVAYGWLLTALAVLSAAVTVCAAEGRLG